MEFWSLKVLLERKRYKKVRRKSLRPWSIAVISENHLRTEAYVNFYCAVWDSHFFTGYYMWNLVFQVEAGQQIRPKNARSIQFMNICDFFFHLGSFALHCNWPAQPELSMPWGYRGRNVTWTRTYRQLRTATHARFLSLCLLCPLLSRFL